jgi:hypothetical protein
VAAAAAAAVAFPSSVTPVATQSGVDIQQLQVYKPNPYRNNSFADPGICFHVFLTFFFRSSYSHIQSLLSPN